MSEYQISKEIIDYKNCIKLDLNEFDYAHHPKVYSAIIKSVIEPKGITHYSNIYNTNTIDLLEKISTYNCVDKDNILVAAGSDDALGYIIDRYINTSTNVIIFMPSYSYFEIIIKRKTNNIHYIPIDFNSDNNINIEECLEFYSDILDKSVVYIVNPNNPLGVLTNKSSIENVIKLYKTTLFIIDEAYIEFCKEETCVNLIYKYDNIIITRTFSKAYGLAGIRLGYLIANKSTVKYVKELYNEKNTTDIAKCAGIEIFNNIKYYENIITECINSRDNLKLFLDNLGIYNVKSNANFISFYIGKNYKKFLELLQSKNIFIRDRSTQIDMFGFVRVTIGKKENMEIFKKVILESQELFDKNPLIKYYLPKIKVWKLKLLFKKVVNILNTHKLTYWLDSGSLLGFYRHNKGLIQWDDDIDIGIFETECDLLLSLKKSFTDNGLRLQLNRTECYYQVDFISDVKSELINDIHIDIFKFKEINNKFINTDPRFSMNDSIKCNFIYDKQDLFPITKDKFYSILSVNVPNNIKDILNKNMLSSDYMYIAKLEKDNIKYEFDLNNIFFS